MQKTWLKFLGDYDIMRNSVAPEAIDLYKSAPAHAGRNLVLGSQDTMYPDLDRDRAGGCIRDIEHCYNRDGRASRAPRQYREGRLHRQDRRRRSRLCIPSAARRRSSSPRKHPAMGSWAALSRRGTLWLSATKGRKAAPACRRCSIPRRTSSQ